MAQKMSPRLAAIVDALPLRPGMRVLEWWLFYETYMWCLRGNPSNHR